jgi:hypothetical protein
MKRIPEAVWSGTFTLFGVEVRCHVLDNGQRLIEAESFEELLLAMASEAPGIRLDPDDLGKFTRWMRP